jgi:hypothetical protein
VWSWIKPETRVRKRCILLHYHIFKNAGTTVSFILERNFGRRVAFLDSGNFNAVLDNHTLIDFLQKHPRVTAVSSHQLRPPKPKDERFLFRDILFLRNPLARLSSTYDFYRRTDITQDPLTSEAKRRNTADFMRLLIEDYPQYVNNVQVNYLVAQNRQNGESDLQTAFRVACDATVLGVTELFDIGAVMAEYSLSGFFERLNFGYVAQNVSSMKPRQLDVHLGQFRDACGDLIYEDLLQCNALDLELLSLAGKEVYRRFQLIPDHEERLNHFLLWRSILHPSSMRGVLASNHPHDFIRYANLGLN